MNPQYLPQQQYGTPSQGFQNVPLGPPKGGTSQNSPPLPPPSSSSTGNQGQFNNLLGKMPTGNLGPFTVLPQRIDGNSNNNSEKDFKSNDGSLNNNLMNGPPRTSFVQNGSNSIPSSQLPPRASAARSNQSSSSPNRPSPSLTPSNQSDQSQSNVPTSDFLSQINPKINQTMPPQSMPSSVQKQFENVFPSQSMQNTVAPQNSFSENRSMTNIGMQQHNLAQNVSLMNKPPPMSMPQSQNIAPPKIPTSQNIPSQSMPPQRGMPSQNVPLQNVPLQKVPSMNMPPQSGLPQSIPPQNVPLQSMPPQNVPPQGMPPQNIQSQNMPPQNVPPQGMPPQNIQPQNMPPQDVSSQNIPPQNVPPQSIPPPQKMFPPHMPPPQSNPPNQNLPPAQKTQLPHPNFPPQRMQGPPQNVQQVQSKPPIPGGMMPPPPTSNVQNRVGFLNQSTVGGYNQPPFSGQLPVPQYQYGNQPPMVGSIRPPLPGQPLQNMNAPPQAQYSGQHLTNQMQNMHLSGPNNKNYPLNGGDHGPHMPPPPPVNGQQSMRSPAGYPPMPGQIPGGGYPAQGYPQQDGYESQAQQQRARLDPDQMPSPIQVISEDQNNRSGVFVTNQKGLVPPLVTTSFVVQDQGNASPRFMRSTMYDVPISHDIIKQTAVPFSLVISPMARLVDGEYPPPIVNFGELGPVRCIRCKAYMCPYMNFVDAGRRFQCAFCKATTDVPAQYFQHLDHNGQRMDRYERPELVLGTYEFIATADYCRNNVLPKPPAVIFVIDVSYNSIKSGLVRLLCGQMKEIIRNLPVDQGMESSNMKVGFITYNSVVHFYNIKGSLAAPQMLVVGDTQEMFMPLLDGFLSTPEESEAIIDALMEQIPAMFGDTRETETVLLPAITAGLEALKASECSGKLMVFNSNLPSAEAPGKLKNRDDRKLLGTDKERTILTPQNQAYNQLGQDCVQFGCSVDLFLFNNSYIDVATIGQVSRLSGGEVFKYTYFQADIDGDRLIGDIIMDISRPIAFDAIMRVRTSTGVRPTDFYGHFFMSNTTDMELAAIDCDKAVALEIKHDDKLQEGDGVFIQSALLYTSCSGQRRLRICNLSLKTCSQMAELYRSSDLDTLINYIAKQALFKLMDNNPKAVKDAIVARSAQILATYRKNCASPSSAGQLILPEFMKLLPLYTNCLLKSDALSGGSDMTVDERSYVIQAVMTMDVPTSVNYFYPRLMPIHELDPNDKETMKPKQIRCSIEKMSEQGVYILENGIYMFLWIGLGVNPDFIQKVFGVQSAVQVNIEQTRLPELDNPLSLYIRNVIEEIRLQRHRNMRLTLVRQREKLEPVFKHFLVEDRGVDGSPSYVDFLCHMHKEIRNLLS